MPRGKPGTGGAPPIDPSDAEKAALAPANSRGALPTNGMYLAISPQIHEELVSAIRRFPTFRTACAACLVSHNTVTSWLRRGAMAGAPVELARFAADFVRADAEHALEIFELFMKAARDGKRGAGELLKFMSAKWHMSSDFDVSSLLDGGSKRSDNLHELLKNPTPRLRAILAVCGWVRHPMWGTPDWNRVIQTVGVEAPAKPAGDDA